MAESSETKKEKDFPINGPAQKGRVSNTNFKLRKGHQMKNERNKNKSLAKFKINLENIRTLK